MSQYPPSGQQFPGGYPNQPYGQPGQYGMPGQMPPQGYGPPPSNSGGSNVLAGVLIGCGVIFLLVVGVCGFAGYRAYQGVQSFGIEIASLVADVAIESAEGVTPDEKTRMKAQVDRVKKGFREGKVTLEEAGDTFTSVADSNVMKAINANSMVSPLASHPELTPDEKKGAELTRMRIARGVLDGKIQVDRVTQITSELGGAFANDFNHFSEEDMDSESDPEEDVDIDEVNSTSDDASANDRAAQVKKVAADKVRETLKKLDAVADETGVAKDEAQLKVDYADEVKKIVDQKLGPKGI
jgi:hypothetical protein